MSMYELSIFFSEIVTHWYATTHGPKPSFRFLFKRKQCLLSSRPIAMRLASSHRSSHELPAVQVVNLYDSFPAVGRLPPPL